MRSKNKTKTHSSLSSTEEQSKEMVSGDNKPMVGNYTYVGLDIDTTGRRLIDEVSFTLTPK
jgi:hypothetical protein